MIEVAFWKWDQIKLSFIFKFIHLFIFFFFEYDIWLSSFLIFRANTKLS